MTLFDVYCKLTASNDKTNIMVGVFEQVSSDPDNYPKIYSISKMANEDLYGMVNYRVLSINMETGYIYVVKGDY